MSVVPASEPARGDICKGAVCLNCGSARPTLWAEARDVEYLTSQAMFCYLYCAECGALSIAPRPQSLTEIYPKNYYSYAESGESFSTRAKAWLERRMFARILCQIPGEKLSVLDVGGGSGWVLDVIRMADPRVSLTAVLDIEETAAATAVAHGHEFHCGRVEDFQPGRKFDLILLLNLIEHVEAPGLVLQKLSSLLSPAGIAVIKTPNYRSLDARIFRHRNWGGYHCPRHWVLYDQPSFAKAVNKAGLEVVSAAYTQGAPFWTVSVLAWLADCGLVKISAERPAYRHWLYQPLVVFSAAFDFLRMPFMRTSQMFFQVRIRRDRELR